jgi:hypothetical protein
LKYFHSLSIESVKAIPRAKGGLTPRNNTVDVIISYIKETGEDAAR